MIKPDQWEKVDHQIYRTRTPMGWLVRESGEVIHFNVMDHEHMTSGYDWRVALTFVFDPFHRWKV